MARRLRASMMADPQVTRFLGDGRPLSRGDAWRQMAMIIGHWTPRGFGLCAVEERASGRFLGRIGCHEPEGFPAFEVGYVLVRDAWGHGYAREGVAASLRFAREVLRRDAIASIIRPDNADSIPGEGLDAQAGVASTAAIEQNCVGRAGGVDRIAAHLANPSPPAGMPSSPRSLAPLPSRAALLVSALLVVGACAGGSSQSPAGPQAIPDIGTYPPLPNDAAPGASAAATATAAAIGRGVNFGNMLEAPTEGTWGLTVTDDFIDKAAAAGFTSVRVPVRWSNHAAAEAPYAIDAAFMARVESVIDKLLAKGLVVIVNMHHYRQLDGDPLDAGEASVASAAADVRFVMLWEQIATRFRGRSSRLVFELYNEPHGRLNGEPWNVLAARALNVVRKSNPDRVVVIGPTSWNSARDLQRLKMPNDANLIATVHDYDPFRFTHQGAEWVSPVLPVGVTCCSAAQEAELTEPLDIAKAWSEAKRYPVFVGEFGAYSKGDDASRMEFNRKIRQAMEARGMTWAYWEFAAGFGVYDPVKLSFRQGLLDSLLGR